MLTGEEDSFGLMIQCEDCGIWQHGECVNIPNKALSPKHYYCEACRPNMHPYNKHLLSGNWRCAFSFHIALGFKLNFSSIFS